MRDQASDVPIIILTVFDVENLAINAVQSGAQDYLIKGKINPDLLTRSIQYAIERNKSEAALRKSEEKYRFLLENLNDIIYQEDNEGNLTYINKKGLEAFEVAEVDIIGQPWAPNIHPDDLDGALKAYQEMLRDGKTLINYECRFVAKRGEGRIFPVIQNIDVLKDEAGNIIGTQGIARDITERIRMEENLREEHLKFQPFLENAPIGMLMIEEDFTYSYINPKFKDIFGYDPKDIPNGKEWFEKAFPDLEYRRLVKATWIQDLKGSKASEKKPRTFTVTCRDGTEKTANFVAVQLKGRKCLLFCEDISERRQAEDALKESGKRLNLTIEGANLGIWDWNVATDEIVFNNRMAEILGYSADEMENDQKIWIGLVHPDDLSYMNNALQDHLDGKTPSYESNYRLKRKDETWIWVHEQGAVIERDDTSRPVRMTGVLMDVTEVQLYQDALKEANLKLNLLSDITRHDILNQIMGLSGYITLLDEILAEKKDPTVEKCIDNITNLTGTIRRQIIFTRDYQDMGIKSPEWQHIETVVHQASKNVTLGDINLQVTTGPLELFADPMLEKIFNNLIDNAIRHGKSVSEIQVSFQEQNSRGAIVVEDNGVGVSAEEKDLIFDRKFGKNTGYGLFLTREVLGITGMTIRETGLEGKGAKFEIEIPKEYYRMAQVSDGAVLSQVDGE